MQFENASAGFDGPGLAVIILIDDTINVRASSVRPRATLAVRATLARSLHAGPTA